MTHPPLNGRKSEVPEFLPEPDLTHYLTLRRAWEQGRIQLATWEQALLTFQASLCAVYGFGPEDAIDERGRVHRAPPGSGTPEVIPGAWVPEEVNP